MLIRNMADSARRGAFTGTCIGMGLVMEMFKAGDTFETTYGGQMPESTADFQYTWEDKLRYHIALLGITIAACRLAGGMAGAGYVLVNEARNALHRSGVFGASVATPVITVPAAPGGPRPSILRKYNS